MKKSDIKIGQEYAYRRANEVGSFPKRVRILEYIEIEYQNPRRVGWEPPKKFKRWRCAMLDRNTGQQLDTGVSLMSEFDRTTNTKERLLSADNEPEERALEGRYIHCAWEEWESQQRKQKRAHEKATQEQDRAKVAASHLLSELRRLGLRIHGHQCSARGDTYRSRYCKEVRLQVSADTAEELCRLLGRFSP